MPSSGYNFAMVSVSLILKRDQVRRSAYLVPFQKPLPTTHCKLLNTGTRRPADFPFQKQMFLEVLSNQTNRPQPGSGGSCLDTRSTGMSWFSS